MAEEGISVQEATTPHKNDVKTAKPSHNPSIGIVHALTNPAEVHVTTDVEDQKRQSEITQQLATLDQDRRSENEKQPFRESMQKVIDFTNAVFENNVPPLVEQRLQRLQDPDSIVTDPEKFKARIIAQHGAESVKGRMTAAFYDLSEDIVYLPEGTDPETAVHEILHLVSSHKADSVSHSGITLPFDRSAQVSDELATEAFGHLFNPGKYDVLDVKPNEAITEILALFIESGIDKNDPMALQKVESYMEHLKSSGEYFPAGSYNDYVKNALHYMTSRLRTTDIIQDIGREYLQGSQEGFLQMLDKRRGIVGRLGRTKPSKEFKKIVATEGVEDTELLKYAIEGVAQRFQDDERFPQHMKDALSQFSRALDSKEFAVEIRHPESKSDFDSLAKDEIVISSPHNHDTSGRKARIHIDTSLYDALVPQLQDGEEMSGPFNYLPQLEGYLLWHAIRLDHILKNGIHYDVERDEIVDKTGQQIDHLMDFELFRNPTMQEFLGTLNSTELAYTRRTLRALIGGEFDSEEDNEAILRHRPTNDQDAGYIIVDESVSKKDIFRIERENNIPFDGSFDANGKVYIPKIDTTQIERLHS